MVCHVSHTHHIHPSGHFTISYASLTLAWCRWSGNRTIRPIFILLLCKRTVRLMRMGGEDLAGSHRVPHHCVQSQGNSAFGVSLRLLPTPVRWHFEHCRRSYDLSTMSTNSKRRDAPAVKREYSPEFSFPVGAPPVSQNPPLA